MAKGYISGIAYPLRFVILIWAIFVASWLMQWNLGILGIFPRTGWGLIGILTAPLLHGSLMHLISNSIPMLVLGTVLFMFYSKVAYQVFTYCYFATNTLVWLFARPSFHIGASGLVYGIAFFLFFIGISRRDFRSLLISIVTVLFYGSIIYGVIPGEEFVSWESHLAGAMVGIYSAFKFSKKAK
jgi:membrane associated rhomboid family serine protease